jgi:CheY-like chemotaxis protein
MDLFAESILVVDDDPYIQEALKDRLESLGYRVLLAADGQQALELLEHQDPQLVLLDIEMPGMKGLDVLKEVRRKKGTFP